ncbi:16S rRNA (guanine(527)-N(7))-methyltransferase RsmG [Nocardioides perillae]|uniref:Ribosomal RNA small subunit methyltransferase G n=1 Tax=Nocardioides perillae TaxID=1119534 RepID=A0A7Y9UKN9_9ACTN|nr:16S rRNA (guanine527-N7)-methyltransferase [Nocardioides perillae]
MFPADRLPLVEEYAALLADDAVVRGLIGPREVPRLWERHLLGCAVVGDALRPTDRTLVDLGSGAGLPGLVLALRHPALAVTLVEPLLRRTTFLGAVVESLGLDNVRVVRGRAEDLHGHEVFDVVTSRAVAPLPRLLGWSMPLVAPTGRLVVMKGARVHDEVVEAAPELASWSAAAPAVLHVGGGVVDPPTTVLTVSWAEPERVGWPLRPHPSPRAPQQAAGPVRRRSTRGGRGRGGPSRRQHR